jgi:hypothetical protein
MYTSNFFKNDVKKQQIFVEPCMYEAVGILSVMPSLLSHVLRGRSQDSLFFVVSSVIMVILFNISGVMISVLTLGAVDLGSSSGRVKPMTIKLVFVASPLSTHAAIRSKSKDWLAENQDNVSEWGDTLS